MDNLIAARPGVRQFPLSGLSQDAASNLLLHLIGNQRPDLDARDVERLILFAKGNPFGLGLIAQLLQEGESVSNLIASTTPLMRTAVRPMQGFAQLRAFPEFGVAQHRGHRDAARALGESLIGLPPNGLRNGGARALGRGQPRIGQMEGRAQHPRTRARPEGHPNRVRPLLREVRPIEISDCGLRLRTPA